MAQSANMTAIESSKPAAVRRTQVTASNLSDRWVGARTEDMVFREARTTAEILELLRLRCRAFRGSKAESFEPDSVVGYNLDTYDPFARHFGLFLRQSGAQQPVGYLRVVEGEGTAPHPHVVALCNQHPLNSTTYPGAKAEPLPVMIYWPERQVLKTLYRRVAACGARVVEASRLSLLPDYRSMNLARFIVDSAVAVYFFRERIDAAFLSALSRHREFYRRGGFRRVPGTSDRPVPAAVGICCCLVARRVWVPRARVAAAQQMALEFAATAEIRFSTSASNLSRVACA